MSEVAPNTSSVPTSAGDDAISSKAASAPPRKRPKPGERRIQILKALASMLEKPGAERVTTAALAAQLEVSEAALYRHFASKAQMFEGLIDFIEQSIFSLVNQIAERELPGHARAAQIVEMLLHFSEKNPGMTRVMVGDALVFENDRLQQRMNLFFDKIEAALRQSLREGHGADAQADPAPKASATALGPEAEAQVQASVLTAFVVGRLQRFARSGFRRLPSEYLAAGLARML